MPAAASDHLSLTLPDWRTAAKKAFRRPPRPKDWFWLFFAVLNAVSVFLAVFTTFDGWEYALVINGVSFMCGWRWGWKGPPKFTSLMLPGDEHKRLPEWIDYPIAIWLTTYCSLSLLAILVGWID